MNPEHRSPAILVAHDGELDDVGALLTETGASWTEQRGGPASAAEGTEAWDVVIASPQRLLERRHRRLRGAPPRLAIVEKETRTLVSMLRRSGVEYVVCRPVHPAALRLLVLHLLYCGPEKRRRERISIGSPIRFRSGMFARRAILAELSTRGCRLLSSHAARRDGSVKVMLPATLTKEKTLSLRGRVVRTGPASGEEAGTQAIAVVFEKLTREDVRRLQKLMAEYARGPASLPGAAPTRRETVCAGEAKASVAPDRIAPSVETPPALPDPEPDRRGDERHEYSQSVIALGREAARVLIGRDISTGGLRVDPSTQIALGDDLQIAVHVRARTEPLVVRARVERDDGARGLVLRFVDLDELARDYLSKMVHSLPLVGSSAPADEDRDVMVTEILEHDPRA